jgi:predicted O-methyltransferase YrrM
MTDGNGRFEALQHHGEISAFAALLKEQGVRSYLEIGSKFGGSAWYVGSNMPNGMRMVLVDMPRGTVRWHESEPSLKRCAEALSNCGHQVDIIWGDSTDPKVIEQVRQHAPFDAILIDANHTRPYLEKDWANYGPMGKIIAFHDIAWKRPWNELKMMKHPIDVPHFWNHIKEHYFNVEIKLDPKGKDNGIGVLWRA